MQPAFLRFNKPGALTTDLATLLARTGALQAATPTARAHVRLPARREQPHDANPRIAVFAPDVSFSRFVPAVASFAEQLGISSGAVNHFEAPVYLGVSAFLQAAAVEQENEATFETFGPATEAA